MTKQIKIGNVTFTQINGKFSKTYESDNGYMIHFPYKNEKGWLKAIQKMQIK